MTPKRQKRIIAPAWATQLREHIEVQGRGFQAKMASATGCSEGLITRIKNETIDSSEWVETITNYCNLSMPPLAVDEAQAEMLKLSGKMSAANKMIVLQLMRGLVGDQNFPKKDE